MYKRLLVILLNCHHFTTVTNDDIRFKKILRNELSSAAITFGSKRMSHTSFAFLNLEYCSKKLTSEEPDETSGTD